MPESVFDMLARIRESGERQSGVVVNIGRDFFLFGRTRGLGDDLWPVYEQFFQAALDMGDWDLAQASLTALQEKFPTSKRVRLLDGQFNEAQGVADVAEQIYDEVLAEDETDVMAMKRKIALQTSRGDVKGAIGGLVQYLDTFSNDTEAWLELAHLYLGELMYQQAAYCLEELIILQPIHHIYHLKYAEVMYTLKDYALAAKSYCRVLELCSGHVRALYGLKLCLGRLGQSGKMDGLEHGKKLDMLAVEKLTQAYEEGCPRAMRGEVRRVVDGWLLG